MSKAKLILSPAFYTDLKEIRHMYQQAFKSIYDKYQDRKPTPTVNRWKAYRKSSNGITMPSSL